MSERYAGISLGVDISQVERAAKSLRQFKQANEQAAQGMQEFVDTEQVAKQRSKEFAETLSKQKREFKSIQSAIDPTAAKMERLRNAASQLDKLWKKGVVPDQDFFQMGEMLETQIGKLERNRKALTEEGRAALEESKRKERARLEAQRFIAALQAQADAAEKTQSELLEMKAAQLGVSAQAAPFIANLRAQEQQIAKMGISVGQYRQAMRMLPAQITDVATSLASGMPIWLVAIQQGGQIKDQFGGIGNALRAVLKFLNPFKIGLAGIVGTLGYMAIGAYKSKKELEDITKTIQDGTGVSEQFAKQLAVVVQDLADVSGKTSEEIAKAYISTKDGASQAITKLVDVGLSYKEAAAKVSEYKNESNFTKLNGVIAEHQQKVADLERSWWDVAKAKLKAMGSVLIGDPQGEYAGKKQTRRTSRAEEELDFMKKFHEESKKANEELQKEIAKTSAEVDKQNLSLNRVRAAQEALNEAIKQQTLLSKYGTEEDKKRAAQNVAFRKKELEEVKKAQETKSGKKGGGAGRVITEQLDKELYVLRAQLETLKEHRTVNDVISNQRKSLWSLEKQIQILQEAGSKRTLTAAEKQLLSENKKALALAREKAEIGDQIVLQERRNKLEQDSVNFVRQTGNEIEALTMKQQGLTDEMIRREQEMQKIKADYLAKGGAADDEALAKMLAKRQEYYANEDKLRLNWLAGAKEAWNQYGEDAFNMYDNVQNIASNALNGLTDQMTDFLTTGKANFKDFANSIIKMIVQMITKMAIFNTISGLTGGKTFTIGSLLKGFSSGGYTGDGGKYDPAGVVHKGEFVFTKEATQRIGAKNLYRLMRGYANGGQVGGNTYSGASAGGAGTNFNIGDVSVMVNNGSDPKGLESGVRMIVTRMLRESCTQGGEIFEFVMSKRG